MVGIKTQTFDFNFKRIGCAMKASGAISSFLSHHHAGVYTTMRTVCKGQKIFAFNEHVRRLALVREAIDPSTKYGGFDEEATRRLVAPRVRDAILSKKKVMSDRHHDDNAGELKVSVALRMREGPSVAQASLEDMEVQPNDPEKKRGCF